MMLTSKITTVNKSQSTNRTGELLQNVWSSNANAIDEINEAGEFCFTSSKIQSARKYVHLLMGVKRCCISQHPILQTLKFYLR